MTADCGCAYDWRIEVLDLQNGTQKGYLTPLSFNFEEKLNDAGNAQMTIPVRSTTMDMVWPHRTSIAFLRISGPGATPSNPVCEFIGMVEQIQPDSGGTLNIGMKSIEYYLNYRILDQTLTYTNHMQTQICAGLIAAVAVNGIHLYGFAEDSAFLRDRTYEQKDYKKVFEAIQQMTQVIDGPDYILTHTFHFGLWETRMTFADYIGDTTPKPLNAARGIISYDLPVDGTTHVNRIVGIGENDTLVFDADQIAGSAYPAFERSEAYSDVSILSTVQEHAEGSLQIDISPTATPGVTLAGVDIIAPLSLGDTIELTMGHGAIQYKGTARITGIAWSSTANTPTMATLTLVPDTSAEQSILNAPPSSSGCC